MITGEPPPSPRGQGRARAWNRGFFLLWQGQFLSAVGAQLSQVTLVLWLYQASGSSAGVGLLLALSSIPGVVLGPLAGVLGDRLSRKGLLVGSDLVQGLLCFVLVGMIGMGATGPRLLAAVFMVGTLTAVVDTIFTATVGAVVPDLVPGRGVEAANAFSASAHEVAKLVGQGVGGVLPTLIGVPAVIALDGLTYLYAALSELFIRLPGRESAGDRARSIGAIARRTAADVGEGVRFVLESPGRWQLLGAAGLLNFFIVPFFVVLPERTVTELGLGPSWYGYAMAALGLGSLVGALVAGSLTLSGTARGRSLLVALPLTGLAIALTGCSSSRWLLGAGSLALGLILGYINVPIRTLLQATTPRELRGRVFGLQQMVMGGLAPLGYGACTLAVVALRRHPGLLPPSLGLASTVLIGSGLSVMLIALATASSAAFRDFLGTPLWSVGHA